MPLPQCIIGSDGERTRIAIDKFFLRFGSDINDDNYIKELNEIYRRQMALGCAVCGTPKRFGVGSCIRCYRLRPRLRELELIIGTSISYPIWKVQRDFSSFAKQLASNQTLTRSQKLDALLRWKPETLQS